MFICPHYVWCLRGGGRERRKGDGGGVMEKLIQEDEMVGGNESVEKEAQSYNYERVGRSRGR